MCWKCNKNTVSSVSSRSDTCPVCGKDLHSCRNCKFYAPGSHYDCHESVDENISDKEKANFCDYFKLNTEFEGGSSSSKADDAKKAFEALFSI